MYIYTLIILGIAYVLTIPKSSLPPPGPRPPITLPGPITWPPPPAE